MKTSLRACALLVPIALLYASFLKYAPVYLTHDEVMFALNAHSLAFSGHDLNGRLFPLYINIGPGFWAPPIDIYWATVFLRFLPVTDAIIRLPTAIMATIDVVAMYFVARKVFEREMLALLAAGLLALTPAHFMMGRMLIGSLYAAGFVTLWLLCLRAYLTSRKTRTLFAATLLLGIGF